MFTLYSTNNYFDKETYIEGLHHLNIDSYAVDNGVMINLDQYKKNYSGARAWHIVYMNHSFIKQLIEEQE